MTDHEIDARAREVAHAHSAACRNRPAVYENQGHGKACDRLFEAIRDAMHDAAETT